MTPDVGIDGGEDIVHDKNAGARVDGSGQRHTPLLATAQVDSVGSNLGVLAVREHVQVFLQRADLDCLVVTLLDVGQSEGDVVSNASILDPRNLGDVGDGFGDNPVALVGLAVVAVGERGRPRDVQLASENVHLTQNGGEHQTLSGSGLARDDREFSLGEGNVDVAEDEAILVGNLFVFRPGDGGVVESDLVGRLRNDRDFGRVQVLLDTLDRDPRVQEISGEFRDDREGNLEGLEDTQTDKGDRREQGTVDGGVDGERDGREENGAGDPAGEKRGIAHEDIPDAAELPLSYLADLGLPIGLQSGEFDLPNALESFGDHLGLLVSDLHQSILGIRVSLGEVNIDRHDGHHGRETCQQRLPPKQGDKEAERHDKLEKTAREQVLVGAKIGHSSCVHAYQVDGALLALLELLGIVDRLVWFGGLGCLSCGVGLLGRLLLGLVTALDVLPPHGLFEDQTRQLAAHGNSQLGPGEPEHVGLDPGLRNNHNAQPHNPDPHIDAVLLLRSTALEDSQELQNDPLRGKVKDRCAESEDPLYGKRLPVSEG